MTFVPRAPSQLAPGTGLGLTYGQQYGVTWSADDDKPQSPIDAVNSASMWRVSVVGSAGIRATLRYGTNTAIRITDLALPMVAYVPGQVGVTLYPGEERVAKEALVTLTPTGYGRQVLRSHLNEGDNPPVQLFPPTAVRYTAFSASTVVTAGFSINLAANESCDVFGVESALLVGFGFVDHEV